MTKPLLPSWFYNAPLDVNGRKLCVGDTVRTADIRLKYELGVPVYADPDLSNEDGRNSVVAVKPYDYDPKWLPLPVYQGRVVELRSTNCLCVELDEGGTISSAAFMWEADGTPIPTAWAHLLNSELPEDV